MFFCGLKKNFCFMNKTSCIAVSTGGRMTSQGANLLSEQKRCQGNLDDFSKKKTGWLGYIGYYIGDKTKPSFFW